MNTYKLIGPFSQLLPMTGLDNKGPLPDSYLKIINDAALIIKNNIIWKVGSFKELVKEADFLKAEIIHIDTQSVCLPGFIDCHTHICFGGTRSEDFAKRNSGISYLDIAAAGGGIQNTVSETRASSKQELIRTLKARANRHLNEGVTTIEVKSGYGLNIETELKMLEAIKESETGADLISTCLAAHTLPKDFKGKHNDYLNFLLMDLLPQIKSKDLANRVDIFIEQGAFNIEDSINYLSKAKKLGFDITIHADQFSVGGSEVAISVKALSADHLEVSGQREIAQLANSDVVPVALPGASLGLGARFTPARKLLDAGASLAIASDWNPGSAPMGDLLMQATTLAAYEKISNTELFAAITFRAAAALGLNDRGKLQEGNIADFCVFETDNYKDITWHMGKLKPREVWKNGARI